MAVLMSVIFCVSLLGNLATILTIRSDRATSSYQQLQLSLCWADLLLAGCGPLASASLNLAFITGHLQPGHFLQDSLFHKFTQSAEAQAASFGSDNVIETDIPYLVLSAVGISLSTTVSIVTIACMAVLRWVVTAGCTEKIRTIENCLTAFISSVWLFGKISRSEQIQRNKQFLSSGVLISMLFLYNFESGEFELHSFFDPLSKVSILLPSVSVSTSFHFQVIFSLSSNCHIAYCD